VIKLTISSGFKNLKAPNIIGLSIPEAKEELNDFGIDLVIKHGSANDGVAITSQNPPAGSLLKKAVIEVEFSRTTIVPDILGLKLNDAVKKIEESNLKVGRKEFVETNMAQSGTVLDQNPKADLEIIVSSPVNLVIAK
jgi:serine/threonine-protein kinase